MDGIRHYFGGWRRRHSLSSGGYFRALSVESLEYRTLLSSNPVVSTTLLDVIATPDTAATAKNTQSKIWQHDGLWWGVLAVNGTGTWLVRLGGTAWTPLLQLSSSRLAADVKPVGDGTITHVFLFDSGTSKLASLEYVPGSPGTYQLWHMRTALASIPISSGAKTGTIDIDSTGRMWEANDATSTVEIHYSDSPYSIWSGPITLATGIGTIDNGTTKVAEISAITALPNGTIGVMWSDHTTKRFGFRVHVDGADPIAWSANEVPASQSAQDVGHGMADDHIHLAVSADGTLYAAVKTAYDAGTISAPEEALLVRHPAAGGQPAYWDSLYGIDGHGTRQIDVVNDALGYVMFAYLGETGVNDIVYKNIFFADIDPNNPTKFYNAPRQTLVSGGLSKNVNSVKGSFGNDLVVVWTNASTGAYSTSGGSGPYFVGGARIATSNNNANQPPVNSVPGVQTILEETSLTFSTANGNAISIADPDAGNGTLRVTLTATGGTLTIGTSGISVTSNGTSNVVATGTLTNLNAGLNGLVFTPNANFNGVASLQILTDDQGNTGGSSQTDSDFVSINVTAVNDVPAFVKGANQTVNEDAGALLIANWATGISAGPANESVQALTFIVTNNNNGLFSVQPSLTSAGTLSYTPAANGSATVTVVLKDNGGVANGGVDTSAPQSFTITVNAVNDAPSFNKGPDLALLQDSGPQLIAGWATSISAGPSNEAGQQLTFVVINDNTGLFAVQPAIDAATGNLSFTSAAGAVGSATVSVVLKDNGGLANGGNDTSAAQTFTITVLPVNLHVTTVADSGAGSLRQAILDANANQTTAHTIHFDMSGVGSYRIPLGSSWPAISGAATFRVEAGTSVELAGPSALGLASGAALTKDGSGTLSITAPQSNAAGSVWNAASGTLNFLTDTGSNLTVNANSTVNFTGTQHVAALNIASGVTVDLSAGGGKVLSTNGLSIVGSGKLDLADNDLIVQATASTKNAVLADLTAKITSGYGVSSPHWQGAGITSSTAAASHLTALGLILNENGLGQPIYTTFSGEPVNNNCVLAKFTYFGDANLSGQIDGTDYAFIDNGYNFGLSGWRNGDFNYDGVIDGTDYALIDNAFNNQGAPLSAQVVPLDVLLGLSLQGSDTSNHAAPPSLPFSTTAPTSQPLDTRAVAAALAPSEAELPQPVIRDAAHRIEDSSDLVGVVDDDLLELLAAGGFARQ